MFKVASEYEKAKIVAESKEEKPMIKVEFIKSFLKYRAGQTVLLEEDEAREYIKSGIAREKKV